jgi:Transposase
MPSTGSRACSYATWSISGPLNLRARVTGSTPCEGDVRGRLACFYDRCAQNDDIAELLTLARTISKWEDEIVAAVLTGVTNARSEALNWLATLEARMAYSFRNSANQRRQVRIACARTAQRSRAVTPRRPRLGTRRPDPGLVPSTYALLGNSCVL